MAGAAHVPGLIGIGGKLLLCRQGGAYVIYHGGIARHIKADFGLECRKPAGAGRVDLPVRCGDMYPTGIGGDHVAGVAIEIFAQGQSRAARAEIPKGNIKPGDNLVEGARLATLQGAGLNARVAALTMGAGAVATSQIGPLASAQQLRDVTGFVDRALVQGARMTTGGPATDMPGGGYYYRPTVLCELDRDMEIARDEVFGPVLSVMTYKDMDEALSIANDVAFGLTSCLYSEQADVIDAFVARSESGMLQVNLDSFSENHLPFVGVKDSALGVGGSNGASTIQFYTSEHSVYRKAKA